MSSLHKPEKLFLDIRMAIEDIEKFCHGLTKEAFLANGLVQAAVERKLGIIGEAVSQLARQFPAEAARLPDHKKIIGLRNIIVHAYDVIDPEIVWEIVSDHLPALMEAVRKTLP